MDITGMLNEQLRRDLYFELGVAVQCCMNHTDNGLDLAIKRAVEIHSRLSEPKQIVVAERPVLARMFNESPQSDWMGS